MSWSCQCCASCVYDQIACTLEHRAAPIGDIAPARPTGADFEGAFKEYERARYLRTARVQFESRYHWDNWYHVGGIEREVARQTWSRKTEQQMFDCLSWLYDGFALPGSEQNGSREKAA